MDFVVSYPLSLEETQEQSLIYPHPIISTFPFLVGCLTTVSTLISEVHLLTGCQATRYLGASIISSQVFLASVVGTLHWSHALPSDGGCPS